MNVITRKQWVKSISYIFLFSILISCHDSNESYLKEELTLENVDLRDDYNSVDDVAPSKDKKEDFKSFDQGFIAQTSNQALATNIPENLKIIKTASTRYKVENIEKALNDIKQMLFTQGGYISELRYDKNYNEKKNRFTIKIPKENFDTVLDGIQKFAEETDYVNISTTDVTEKYVDAQTRLQTKMEVKARLEAVLRKNAKTVKDILATENQLRTIQEEIEVVQGKLKYMSSRVAFSTIQVELYETIEYKEEPVAYTKGFGAKAKEGLAAGWNFIQDVLIGILHIWPFIILLTVVVLFFRRWRRARK
ncbi:uncharacterized protein DUF4349 [Kordia periserrulae]|uniref:Uncharacterized protein DUF4349 n=1 Tax=Kordia periserrulae TaxID=701523 RepID=A0A2T6BXV0_9FLAO|nr:DUF4349 domain-containing protein [Kordia periserrulae]PTX60895.1 uncharacterized protein DUF4349 [Kordia periserrulae]